MKTRNKLFLMLGSLVSLYFTFFPSIVYASSGDDSTKLFIVAMITIFPIILVRMFFNTNSILSL